MSTGWNINYHRQIIGYIINLLGNEYWLEHGNCTMLAVRNYKPTGK